LAPFLRLEDQELPGAGLLVTASAPHCSVTVRTALPAPAESPTDWSSWHPAGRGLVRARFVSVVSEGALALGQIHASADGALARLIGGGDSPTVGHWSRFEMNATVETVRPARIRRRPRT
ncbi:MAG: hypothetical protein ACREQY_23390, partial [Candidatus Binatia bacterium]